MSDPDYGALFRALPSPFMILDRSFRYVDANPAYEAAVGRSRHELVGRNLFDLFPGQGDNNRRLLASLRQVLETARPDTLAHIPYDIDEPDAETGAVRHRVWTAVHTPLLDPDGRVTHIVQNTVDVTPIHDLEEGRAGGNAALPPEVALLQRAREVEKAYEASLSEASSLKGLFEQSPGMIAVLSGPDHVFTFANDTYRRFVGNRNVIGKPVRAAVPEVEGQGFFEMLDEVYRTGRSVGGENVRVVLQRHPGSEPEEAFMDFSYRPARDADGRISGVFVQGTDRTDSARAAQRHRLLIDELNHRVKNTLAAVQSIARQSFRNIQDPEAARYAFEARISALSKAHNLLSERQWESASLSTLLRQEMEGVDANRFELRGLDVRLTAKTTVALALVFHELAMNAARHGAISAARGRVRVEWEQESGGRGLAILWRETGVDYDAKAVRAGFGLKLMQRIIEGELDGRLDLEFGGCGVMCRFRIANGGNDDAVSPAA